MEWIKIDSSHELPRDGSNFLALWKGRVSLCQFDSDEGRFYIMFDPADNCQPMQISQGERK